MNDDLTDSQWARLEPLLPPAPSSGRGGRPRYRSRRELIDGMRWRFRTGKRWDRLPARYGPHQTTYALFQAWRKDGTWERLARDLGAGSEARTIIPWASSSSLSTYSRLPEGIRPQPWMAIHPGGADAPSRPSH